MVARIATTAAQSLTMAFLFVVVGPVLFGASGYSPTATERPAVDLAAALITEHDCWTSNGPEGVIPGHVVVTRDGADVPVYAGRIVTGQALEQLFGGADHDLTVHGFCR